jgi:nicotinate-nucleotide adenylyltransferase
VTPLDGTRSPGGRSLPDWAPGMRIGLFGGSFNPPHEGHRLVSTTALRRLRLDRVWWVVTPGNPLKRHDILADLDTRIGAARRMADHPRISVTGLEAGIGMRYTVDTVRYLKRRCPGVQFVWIMGADNLRQLPRWRRWRDLVDLIPVAVVDRPGSTLRSLQGSVAAILAPRRLRETEAHLLPMRSPPAFVYLHGPRSSASSTALRDAGRGLR